MKDAAYEQPGGFLFFFPSSLLDHRVLLPRDVNHCFSRDHLHHTTHHPLLRRAALADNGRKEYKRLENASKRRTIKKIGKGKVGFMFLLRGEG